MELNECDDRRTRDGLLGHLLGFKGARDVLLRPEAVLSPPKLSSRNAQNILRMRRQSDVCQRTISLHVDG